jgi:hypothetical protein
MFTTAIARTCPERSEASKRHLVTAIRRHKEFVICLESRGGFDLEHCQRTTRRANDASMTSFSVSASEASGAL